MKELKNVARFTILGLILLSFIMGCQNEKSNQSPLKELKIVGIYEERLEGKLANLGNVLSMEKVVVQDRYAYIADIREGLMIIDVSNPAQPIKVSSYKSTGGANYVDIEDNYAYLTNVGPSSLSIIDVNNLINPQEVSNIPIYSSITVVVEVNRNYAYFGTREKGFTILDISDIQKPVEIVTNKILRLVRSVDIIDNYAYIVEFNRNNVWGAFYVVDVTVPTNPVEIGTYDNLNGAYDVDVQGDYAYIADGGAGLTILNIANPKNPVFVSQYDTPDNAEAIKVAGNYAYIADLFSLQVVDISDPFNPFEVASYKFQQAVDVDVVGDYIYVADLDNGLFILEMPDLNEKVE